jgi:hypothetical protein
MRNLLRPENWYLAFMALNGCIVISLAIARILHAILSAWGPDPTKKDEIIFDEKED